MCLGAEPFEHLRVEADADRDLAPGAAQPHKVPELLLGQARNVLEINAGVVSGRLYAAGLADGLLLPLSPHSVPDIV